MKHDPDALHTVAKAALALPLHRATALACRLLAAAPGHPHSHYAVGLVALRQDRLQTALAALATAAHLCPDSPEIARALALVLRRGGRADLALLALDRACTLDPAHPEAALTRRALQQTIPPSG
jgi:cytochrome c-type biogenesis protein CcmH/NrfG